MEQHPVPQNVTTFQFRLIGDMTIKQFGYLAGGLIVAYLCYKLPLPFFFTWPLAIFFGLLGFGFAFVPVEERPMDIWVLSFLKNVYNPTQFIWQKQKKSESLSRVPEATRVAPAKGSVSFLDALTGKHTSGGLRQEPQATSHPPPQSPGSPPIAAPVASAPAHPHRGRSLIISEWMIEPFGRIKKLFQSAPKPVAIPPTSPNVLVNTNMSVTGRHLDLNSPSQQPKPIGPLGPTPEEEARKASLEKQLQTLQGELATRHATDARLRQLQEQIATVLTQKSEMENELLLLRRQAATKSQEPSASVRPASIAQATTPSPTVRVVTGDMATHVGLPRLTTFPNVVSGILKETSGNLLPGVLVTVRDKDDVPVRALKTNKLGQFAASTPLPNGVYVIEIEDPRNQFAFDRVQVTLTGGIIPAVEITAKNQKQVEREKLAAQIFGNQSI